MPLPPFLAAHADDCAMAITYDQDPTLLAIDVETWVLTYVESGQALDDWKTQRAATLDWFQHDDAPLF